MPRAARIVVPNFPYHITQRGNYQQNVFQDDEDRLKYLSWIDEYSKKYHLSLFAYCLMNNHVHFIAIPRKEDSLAKVFSIAHMRYSQYLNKKMKTSGHLWQGRFYSCVLDEPYLMAAIRYVEKNPVRAGVVKKAWQWKWSSVGDHIGKGNGVIYLGDIANLIDISIESWKQFLDCDESEGEVSNIRKHTMTGHPLGTTAFITKLGMKAGRALSVLPRGRPKKRSINNSVCPYFSSSCYKS